ncbi:hypothetical protein DKX38_005212 [Salix brachista]|uniref:Uncharacterized protein n=1 Tax=Salix brachista TaxID=2182728 RepID=A0A5N5NDM1_9ROSI|nr:hypothetical protein DKX38_005212 [Salix brachista]
MASKEEGPGTAAMTTTEPHLSFTPQTANSSSSDADAGLSEPPQPCYDLNKGVEVVEAENREGMVVADSCPQATEIPVATVETRRAENLEALEDVVQEAVSEAGASPPPIVPEDPTPENPEVNSLSTNVMELHASYELPYRHNRGKPPKRYSPDVEERKSRAVPLVIQAFISGWISKSLRGTGFPSASITPYKKRFRAFTES